MSNFNINNWLAQTKEGDLITIDKAVNGIDYYCPECGQILHSRALNSEDDISINRYSKLEKLYLLGWRFKKDRIIFINDIERRLSEIEIKYIMFLSEI